MLGLVRPFDLRQRIENYLLYERVDLGTRQQKRFSRLLTTLCMEGEVARGKVPEILGLKGTASRDVIRAALDEGLIASKSEKGALMMAFPNKVIEFYFPLLFTDLPVDD